MSKTRTINLPALPVPGCGALTIAVDGPSASGKGTLARRLARHYGLAHLDTGLLYRATGLALLESKHDFDDPEQAAKLASALDLSALSSDDSDDYVARLRQPEVAEAASRVAAMAPVRAALLDLQRDFARRSPGAVLDGRDIGTTVLPQACVKLFVTATPQVRARRRLQDYQRQGQTRTYSEVLRDIEARDRRDRNRTASPLAVGQNAHLLDTTNLSIDAVFERAVNIVDGAFGRG